LQSIGQLTSEIYCLEKDIIRLKDQTLTLKNEVTQLRIEIQFTGSMPSGGLSIATDDHQQDLEPDALQAQTEIEILHKEIASLREAPGVLLKSTDAFKKKHRNFSIPITENFEARNKGLANSDFQRT
jgi:predicted  nucleic acid-binding Zn-ribbon protein